MIIHKIVLLLSLYLIQVDGGYTITTPRRWTVDQPSQICVTLTEPSSGKDYFTVVFKGISERYLNSKKEKKEIQVSTLKTYSIPKGDKTVCYENVLPKTTETDIGIEIEGNILGKFFSHYEKIAVVKHSEMTFIQTDKYLYKPGQLVQFRMLSLKGPLLHILTDDYAEIWVENPSSSRIRQWNNVNNSDGLIHLSFPLSEEPDQGEYNIKSQFSSGLLFSTTFKVEDYVLPRYEITITPPPYITGISTRATFKVCAKYTFGQPVKGILTLYLDNSGWSTFKVSIEKTANISGCVSIPVLMNDLKISTDRYSSNNIKVKAAVVEDGTDVKLESESVTVPVERVVITFKDVGEQKYRKPEIPFVDEVLAQFPDGTPAIHEPMKVCIDALCKNFTTNANGILKYAIPPHIEGSISINSINYKRVRYEEKTWRSIMFDSNTYRSHKTYHSPSNSSLIIALEDKNMKCKHGKSIDINLLVRYSSVDQANTLIHLQVISRGQIQYFNSSVMDLSRSNNIHIPENIFISPMQETTKSLIRGSFNFPISLPNTVSPKAEILIWYERGDGEVVSDHRSIDIMNCLPNDVKLQWSVGLARPGEEASINVVSEQMSICSIGVVDKSVELLSETHNRLTASKLLKLAEASTVMPNEKVQYDDYEYCKDKFKDSDPIEGPRALPVPLPARAGRLARSTFIGWRPYYSNDVDAIKMFSEAGVFVFSDLTLETRPCEMLSDYNVYYDEAPLMFAFASVGAIPEPPNVALRNTVPNNENSKPDNLKSNTDTRVYFPETWIWDLKIVKNGSLDIPVVLPDTVTEWVGRAVCVHPTKGVGLSKAAAVTTFKDFFIDLTLPVTAKRGEIFPVKISVFNYLKDKLPVKLELRESPDYDILTETKELIGSGFREACVEPEDKTVFNIRIKPRVADLMNITVDAMIDINSVQCGGSNVEERRDIVIKPIRVDYEGFLKEKTWNNYLCTKEDTDGIQDVWDMVVPTGIVEDSARGWLSAVGDLMGPTIENLGHLVRMPYGCGEQNMLNFAPTIFIMQYLEAANLTTPELGTKAIQFMEKGYQRELTYRRSDGSYSAFGNRDPAGSTWLTAFVIKSFSQAQQFIKIDPTDISMSIDWLKSKQMENGCFELVGRVIHKDMKGGIGDSGSPSLLSAYVLLSLLEAGEDPSSPVVREALFCLNADHTTDPYALAVKLYALALAKSPEAQATAKALISLATTMQGTVSWDVHNDEKKSKSTAVEIASYAILSFLTLDSSEYSVLVLNIIKWINQQRNSQGGFISTQDTILALQAMALYETTLPAGEPDASVLFTVNNHEETFIINKANKLLLQRTKLPIVPTSVTMDIFGSGCILVQGVLRYNIPEGDSNKAFSLSVETKTPFDLSCKSKEITICTSYLLSDNASNMAIIEVNLVSGYIPDKKDLISVVGDGKGLFKRYEVDGSTVTFYLDEISKDIICATFKMIRVIDVENVKPGTVKVYDYYKPEYTVSQNYVLPQTNDCSVTRPEMLEEPLPPRREMLIDRPIDYYDIEINA